MSAAAREGVAGVARGKRKLAYADKLLADQAPHVELFAGDRAAFFPALYGAIASTCGLRAPAEELDLAVTDKFTPEEMGSNPVALRFLQMLVALTGATRALEVGTFIGISGSYLARALPDGGKLTTIERGAEFAAIAAENFRRNGVAKKVDLRVGDAKRILRGLPARARFGLIFIDGDKDNYAVYMRMLRPHLAQGGVMVVDDALFHGDVLNPVPTTPKGKGVRAALREAAKWHDCRRILLPISNGMLLILKGKVG
ncbi:MAG: O-methyltransferase [Tagaea sp.]|nr:O-methyltransferase [Tagaea sp.]